MGTLSIREAILVAQWLLQRKLRIADNAPAIPTVPVTVVDGIVPVACAGESGAALISTPAIMEKTSAVACCRMAGQLAEGATVGLPMAGVVISDCRKMLGSSSQRYLRKSASILA